MLDARRQLADDTAAGEATRTPFRSTPVTVRELRNHGGEVLDRVVRGEHPVVTRDGAEVAELGPLARRSPAPADLIALRRHLPKVDPDDLRRDLDAVLDAVLDAEL
jgi:prevent-host-death family protein